MPQYQKQKQGQARIRILSKDATRAYMLLMRQTGGKLQVLPNDVYVVEETVIATLTENQIEFELLEKKSATSPSALLNTSQPDATDKEEGQELPIPAYRRHLGNI